MKKRLLLFWVVLITGYLYAQNEQKFSAVNPALFLYSTEDIYINPPSKYNNGKNIIVPNPKSYPWEARLENGMPNALKDANGNLSIYISSFVSFSEVPYSKVGVMVYTNTTNQLSNWERPNAGLYWYNPAGATADQRISPIAGTGYMSSNIVAVDMESFGLYEDNDVVNKPIKLIYLPQRESGNKVIGAYEMDRNFTSQGILQDFSKMKSDRLTQQKKFTFKFINGDTHMGIVKKNGIYYFVSRLNAKRSSLQPGETPPFERDPRVRYRRETITRIGATFESKNVDFDIALDMSTSKWEPYSLQPFQLPGFSKDIWWGLATMYGSADVPEVANIQRTELAISNDGVHWTYLKPGSPFLDNGADPQSDDHGCINIGRPVMGVKFASSPLDQYYFYAASNKPHVTGRNPGISLAVGKYGKIAGLKGGASEKMFYSMNPSDNPIVEEKDMLKFSISNAFQHGSEFAPYILGDITEDPREKKIVELNSYVAVLMYAYDKAKSHGQGSFLGGVFGSSKQGTTTISDDYEAVGFIREGTDGTSKQVLLKYLKRYSEAHPKEVVSIKDFPEVPIVLEGRVKNATFYGLNFKDKFGGGHFALNADAASDMPSVNLWSHVPIDPQNPCYTENFSTVKKIPNEKLVTESQKGSIAIKVTPKASKNSQTVLRLHGDDNNYMGIYYSPAGSFIYKIAIHGVEFASMTIAPPSGKTFVDKEVVLTFEAVKKGDRKYAQAMDEETAIFRVSCPSIGVDQSIPQSIVWNWKHASGSITPSDSANARAFAYLDFSSFVAGMNKVSVGGKNESCEDSFIGSISRVEISSRLPEGKSDFWTEFSVRTRGAEAELEQANRGLDLMNLFPNPVKSGENIRCQIYSGKKQAVSLSLMNSSGGIIQIIDDLIEIGDNDISIETRGLSPGLYFVRLKSEDDFITKKVIVD